MESKKKASSPLSLDQFISITTPLLDLEKVLYLLAFIIQTLRLKFPTFTYPLSHFTFLILFFLPSSCNCELGCFQFIRKLKKFQTFKKMVNGVASEQMMNHGSSFQFYDPFVFFFLQDAEISSSIATGASRNLDTAQKRGSTILNLKCVDVQVTSFSILLSCFHNWKKVFCFCVCVI